MEAVRNGASIADSLLGRDSCQSGNARYEKTTNYGLSSWMLLGLSITWTRRVLILM